MNLSRFPVATAASVALVALLATACSKNSSTAQVAVTPTPVVATTVTSSGPALPVAGLPETATVAAVTPAPTLPPKPAPAKVAVMPAAPQPIAVQSYSDQAAAAWSAIKDYTFDQRAAFLTGANQMSAMLDKQVAELDAKRRTFPSTVDTGNWDFAMHDMRDSQAYFKSMVTEAGGVSAEFWQQEKDKIEAAWQKAQASFDAVKTTVTYSP